MKAPWVVSPVSLMWMMWVSIVVLYKLNLSEVLQFDVSDFGGLIASILLPFTAAVALYKLLSMGCSTSTNRDSKHAELIDWKKVKIFAYAWIGLTVIEIVFSGGVPIVWLIIGSSKTYFDFGLPSLHGLLIALLSSLSLVFTFSGIVDKKYKFLLVPLLVIFWSIITVTRQLMVVTVIETFSVFVMTKGINFRKFLKYLVCLLSVIIVFGIVGDARSGAEAFVKLAMPTENWPSWLPSGFLWVYIYVVTPLNNLLNSSLNPPLECNALFPAATSLLFPSIVRSLIFGEGNNELWSGDLVTEAFNVSTAFLSPMQDCGFLGVAFYSFILGAVAFFFWRKRKTIFGVLAYAVLCECIIASIFFNHLFYLPIVFQIFFIRLFIKKRAL